jgi:hypothetical protein
VGGAKTLAIDIASDDDEDDDGAGSEPLPAWEQNMKKFERDMLQANCLDADGSRILRIEDDHNERITSFEQHKSDMFIKCSRCNAKLKIQRNAKSVPGLIVGKQHVKAKHRSSVDHPKMKPNEVEVAKLSSMNQNRRIKTFRNTLLEIP